MTRLRNEFHPALTPSADDLRWADNLSTAHDLQAEALDYIRRAKRLFDRADVECGVQLPGWEALDIAHDETGAWDSEAAS